MSLWTWTWYGQECVGAGLNKFSNRWVHLTILAKHEWRKVWIKSSNRAKVTEKRLTRQEPNHCHPHDGGYGIGQVDVWVLVEFSIWSSVRILDLGVGIFVLDHLICPTWHWHLCQVGQMRWPRTKREFLKGMHLEHPRYLFKIHCYLFGHCQSEPDSPKFTNNEKIPLNFKPSLTCHVGIPEREHSPSSTDYFW